MQDAINETKKEFKKIKEYRKKNNPNFHIWEKVNHWTLVSTIKTNPNDENKWGKNIIDVYKDINIKIDFWNISEIESRLNKYEHLVDIYFRKVNRCICTIEDLKYITKKSAFNKNFSSIEFVGREKELSAFKKFIESKYQFLIIKGSYSIGKTRFLYECGKKLEMNKKIVYVGRKELMNISSVWIDYFKNYNEQRVLLIDEPDYDLINKIFNLFSDKNLKDWKVILTISNSGDKLYDEFENRIDTYIINLKPLKILQSYEMIDNYGYNFREKTKFKIFKLSKGIPGLIDLLLLNYEKGKSISLDKIILYTKKILHKDVNKIIILRYISAWRTIIDNDEEKQIEYLSKLLKESEEKIRNIINDFVGIGFVNKLDDSSNIFKCDPPLFRYSVLADWFIKVDQNNNEFVPTNDYNHFIKKLLTNEIPRRDLILNSLVSFISFENATNLAKTFCELFFSSLENSITHSENIIDQINVLDVVETICFLSPENTIKIIKTTLNHKIESKNENIRDDISFINNGYNESDVYHKIIRIIERLVQYNYFSSVQNKRIFNCIKNIYITITNNNNAIKDTFNQLLYNIFEDKKIFDKFKNIAFNYLNEEQVFEQFDLQIAKSLLHSRKSVTEYIDKKIIYSDWFIHQEENDWKMACNVKKLLFNKLNKSESRIKLWEVIIAIHFDWRQSAFLTANQKYKKQYLLEIKNDLMETYSFLSNNICRMNDEEFIAVHEIWEYLLRSYDQSDECCKIANKCELLYSKKINFKYYRYFSDYIGAEEQESIIKDIKNMFSSASSQNVISSFFNNAWKFLLIKNLNSPSHYNFLAHKLSEYCFDLYTNKNYILFIKNSFKSCSNPFLECFLVYTLRLIIKDQKSKNSFHIKHVKSLCFDDRWICMAYYKANIENIGNLTSDELDYILNLNITPDKHIELLPVFIHIDLNKIQNKIEELFAFEKNNYDMLFEKLIDNLYTSLIFQSNFNSDGIFIWLIEKLFIKYNLNANIFENHQFAWIKDICLDKINQDLFSILVARRVKYDKNKKTNSNFIILPSLFKIENWVSNITSKKAVTNICKLVISNKTYFTTNELPLYLAFMNKDGTVIANYVENYLSKNNASIVINNLYYLASLASGFEDDSDSWKIIAKPICEFIENNYTNINNIYNIYYSLSSKTDSNSFEADPFKYEKRMEMAKLLLNNEKEDSPLKPYREWAYLEANNDVKQHQEILRGEDYE